MGAVGRTLRTRSAQETFRLGERLGRLIETGDFVGLIGELGAGKTVFVRGLARGAGVPPREVASPSFAIVYPYRGRIPLAHADFYRLSSYEELWATGFFDLLAGDHAVVVEWLDRIPEAAPRELLLIRFSMAGERVRHLHLEAHGPRHLELARALAPPRRTR